VFSPIKYKIGKGGYSKSLLLYAADLSVILSERAYVLRRKIRLIEGNAKCRHLKKLTIKGTLNQREGERGNRGEYRPQS